MDTKISTPLVERLSEFLSRLTPAAAAKLAHGLERERLKGANGLPYDFILSTIRPILSAAGGARDGAPGPLRQFCLPFEEFLVNEIDPASHERQIRRSSIAPVWAWLENDLLPDTLPDMTRRLADQTLGGDHEAQMGTLAVLHASSSAAILAALDTARRDGAERRRIERTLGGETVVDDAREIARVLSVAASMLELMERLPGHIEDFNERFVSEVGDIYEEARQDSMENAIYVPYAAMRRLAEPWQILRLARKLAGQGNDAAVSRSGLAPLGEIFLGEIEDIADAVGKRRAGRGDLDEMLGQVTRFARVSQGFIREIDIRRCSEWGHRILTARARLSAAIAEEMTRFEQDVMRALPLHQVGSYGKNGPRRPDVTSAPNFDRAERAAACLRFLTGVCPAAESIGAQSHCKTVLQQIETYLVAYEDGLIEEIRRSRAGERANAEAYLEIIAGFRETMGAKDFAQTLRRRGQIASAQAS